MKKVMALIFSLVLLVAFTLTAGCPKPPEAPAPKKEEAPAPPAPPAPPEKK